jgi:PilZ domain
MDHLARTSQRSTLTLSDEANRRAAARIEAQFCTLMSAFRFRKEGSGTVLDLSTIGCRLKTSLTMPQSSLIELRIHIPELDWTIMVDEAIVQWVKENIVGLRFVSLRPTEGDRLAWVISRTAHAK